MHFFVFDSFQSIQSIDLNCLHFSKIIIANQDWLNRNEVIAIDLSLLQSIQLGNGMLKGRDWDSSCSLTMQSNNEMIVKVFQHKHLLIQEVLVLVVIAF